MFKPVFTLQGLESEFRNRLIVEKARIYKAFLRNPVDLRQLERGSDIIFIFAPKGENVVVTERILRTRFNDAQWKSLMLKYWLHTPKVKNKELGVEVNIAWEYIDITVYKKWWEQFLRAPAS